MRTAKTDFSHPKKEAKSHLSTVNLKRTYIKKYIIIFSSIPPNSHVDITNM